MLMVFPSIVMVPNVVLSISMADPRFLSLRIAPEALSPQTPTAPPTAMTSAMPARLDRTVAHYEGREKSVVSPVVAVGKPRRLLANRESVDACK